MGDIQNECLTKEKIIENQGGVVLNSDGTVSVFYNNSTLGLYPVQLTLECCKVLDPTYSFDIDIQKCKWSNVPITCGFSEPINLVINPKGDDGTLFFIDDFENETCDLKISFDYLLKIKCETLNNITNPTITTNYVTDTTLTKINKSQQTIEYLNSEIEIITNRIISLNDEIVITPYSIECLNFPIVTLDPINCVVDDWSAWSTCVNSLETRTRKVLTEPMYGGTSCPVLTETQACVVTPTTCNQYSITTTNLNGEDVIVTDCSGVNNRVYIPYGTTPRVICGTNVRESGTAIIVNNGGCPPVVPTLPCRTYMFNPFNSSRTLSYKDCKGVIQSPTFKPLGPGLYHTFCALGYKADISGVKTGDYFESKAGCFSNMTNTGKLANFDNSGFNSKTIDETLPNTSVYKTDTTTYTKVNYCLTEAGLEIWKNILGQIKYDLFTQPYNPNNPPSHDCADVIKIVEAQKSTTNILFNSCDTPINTKTKLMTELNVLMVKLTDLKTDLTNEQNNLITLETEISSGATSNSLCATPTQALESIDIEMHLDYIDDDKKTKIAFSAATFPAIKTGNLYKYLTTSGDSGFYICGDPSNTDIGLSNCTSLTMNNKIDKSTNVSSCNKLIASLFPDIDLATLPTNALSSNWLTYTTLISDPKVISLITNKKIKISLKVNFSCVDFCILLDNIVLDKSCKIYDRNNILISKNPGFDLKRVVDNKKSWTDVSSQTNRNFLIAKSNGTNPFRQSNYDLSDERLVINSKEIDLDISIASAIETDIWSYLNDNKGLLSGVTYCNPCEDFIKNFQDDECLFFMNGFPYIFMDGVINTNTACCGDSSVDFNKIITTDLSNIKTIIDFENLMSSELIDAKNRQTISGYPTLRAIYERYVSSSNYVNTTSSAFNYINMNNFSNLVGNYWADLIEQVIPSTSIWGSVKIHTNTIFDEQKFKYREYSSIFCNTGKCDTRLELNKTNKIKVIFCGGKDIEIIETTITSTNNPSNTVINSTIYDTIYLSQMSAGSEFLGNIGSGQSKITITE